MEQSIFRSLTPDKPIKIICFHHAGGNLYSYHAWKKYLHPDTQLISLALPGRVDQKDKQPLLDISPIKQCFIDYIRHTAMDEYHLWGHSCGAIWAYSCYQAIHATDLPNPGKLFLSGHPKPTSALIASYQDYSYQQVTEELKLLNPDIFDAQNKYNDEVIQSTLHDYHLTATATDDFIEPIPCEKIITLVGDDEQLFLPEEMMSWQDCSKQIIDSYVIEGDHFYYNQNIVETTAIINKALVKKLPQAALSVVLSEATHFPVNTPIYDLFVQTVLEYREDVAVKTNSMQLSYIDVYQYAECFYEQLTNEVSADNPCCILYISNSVELITAMLACLKANIVYCVILREQTYQQVLSAKETLNGAIIITDDEDFDAANILINQNSLNANHLELPLNSQQGAVPRDTNKTAFMVYSSGTTGQPKLIKCSEKSMINSYYYRAEHFKQDTSGCDGVYTFFIWEALRALLIGRSVYIFDKKEILTLELFEEVVDKNAVDRVLFTPSLLQMLITQHHLQRTKGLFPSEIILNGEVVTDSIIQSLLAYAPSTLIINDYSISECHDITTTAITDKTLSNHYMEVGTPINGVDIFILDEHNDIVPIGEQGYVYIGGCNVGEGYVNAPEEQQKRFIDYQFNQQSHRLFNTGDKGFIDHDGQLYLMGRDKFFVKIRGYSVNPVAIEAATLSYDAIKQCCVITSQEIDDSTESSYFILFIAADHDIDIDKLNQHLKSSLAAYELPSRIQQVPQIPIDQQSDKVDRKKLIVQYCQSTNKPRLDAGISVADIWQTVLSVDTIDENDDFFDLGGDSLLAISLSCTIKAQLSKEVAPHIIYEHSTLKQYVEYIHLNATSTNIPIEITTVSAQAEPIAIVGLSAAGPRFDNVEQFWQLLIDNKCGITSSGANKPNLVNRVGLINRSDYFDYRRWNISKTEARLMDPQQRLLFKHILAAITDAGYTDAEPKHGGVFAGCAPSHYWIERLAEWRQLSPNESHLVETGNDKDYISSKLAYHFNLTGPAITVQTSCSTGLSVVSQAIDSLHNGRCAFAIAATSSLEQNREGYYYQPGHVLSKDGVCRPFSSQANGTLFTDGVAVTVLKPLSQAQADGDKIYAIIESSCINNDGKRKNSFSEPSVQGQQDVISQAIKACHIEDNALAYVEMHGTGTLIGDPIECQALKNALDDNQLHGHLKIGSLKGNIGHSNIAAGGLSLIKLALSIYHQQIPASLHGDTVNPAIEQMDIFEVLSKNYNLLPQDRYFGITSLGIGGTNNHMILSRPAERQANSVSNHASGSLNVAFFTGQGTQSVNMGRALYYQSPIAKQVIDEGIAILAPLLNEFKHNFLYDDAGAIFENPVELQPAIVLLNIALYQIYLEAGLQVDVVYGHSLGEYSAAVVAGSLSLEAALTLVYHRADIVRRQDTHSALLSLPISQSQADTLMNAAGCEDKFYIAISNSQQNTIIGVDADFIDAFKQLCEQHHYQYTVLLTNAAYHTPLLLASHQAFAEQLAAFEFKPPAIRALSSLSHVSHQSDIYQPQYWLKHLTQGLDFHQALSQLNGEGFNILEFSPAKSLQFLNWVGEYPNSHQYHLMLNLTLDNTSLTPEQWVDNLSTSSPAELNLKEEYIEPIALKSQSQHYCYIKSHHFESMATTEASSIEYIRIQSLSALEKTLANQQHSKITLTQPLQSLDDCWQLLKMINQTQANSTDSIEILISYNDTDSSIHFSQAMLKMRLVLEQETRKNNIKLRFYQGELLNHNTEEGIDNVETLLINNQYQLTDYYPIQIEPKVKSLANKIIVITGASGNIAQFIGPQLKSLGATCIGLARSQLSIADIEQRGLAHYHSVNMADSDALFAVLDAVVAQYHRIDVVIHAAGLADLTSVEDLTIEQLHAEAASKIVATHYLHDYRQAQTFDYRLILLSSLASILGGVHMSAYAGVNAYMDSFGVSIDNCCVINFDDWNFKYEHQQLKNYEQSANYHPLDNQFACNYLIHVINSADKQLIISQTDLHERIATWHYIANQQTSSSIDSQSTLLDLKTAITTCFKETLGADSISNEASFFDVGGDSVLAVSLLCHLEQYLPNHNLTIADIFQNQTVNALYDKLKGSPAILQE